MILADGIEPMTIRQLQIDSALVGERVFILPHTSILPAQWSYVFPWAQQVYLAGRPAPALDRALRTATAHGTETWGIGIRSDDTFRARRVTEGLVEVSAIGSGGLLGLPLLTKQVLTMLGLPSA